MGDCKGGNTFPTVFTLPFPVSQKDIVLNAELNLIQLFYFIDIEILTWGG
jgi:hypothetical protein